MRFAARRRPKTDREQIAEYMGILYRQQQRNIAPHSRTELSYPVLDHLSIIGKQSFGRNPSPGAAFLLFRPEEGSEKASFFRLFRGRPGKLPRPWKFQGRRSHQAPTIGEKRRKSAAPGPSRPFSSAPASPCAAGHILRGRLRGFHRRSRRGNFRRIGDHGSGFIRVCFTPVRNRRQLRGSAGRLRSARDHRRLRRPRG